MPRVARAATVIDATGRAIIIPDKVERIFAAGPPAAIVLYTLAPELLLGWTKSPRAKATSALIARRSRPKTRRVLSKANTN